MVMDCLKILAQKANLIVLIISHDNELVNTYAPQGHFYMKEQESGKRLIQFLGAIQDNLF